ncbi:MAG TPA: hypothetical protein DEB09_04550 [Candidatus Magasanikbacteria bacterium]|nr:hypothetical protein [Candidatus Magasanikbacteria bacterium]
MKKFFLLIISLCILPTAVLAVNVGYGNTKGLAEKSGYLETTSETTFSETLGLVIQILLGTVGIFFLALMIYAGILWMTSHGEEEQVQKAQKIIRAAIIGTIVVVGSYALTNFVIFRL